MRLLYFVFALMLSVSGGFLFSQSGLVPLDRHLSTIKYPFEVHLFEFNTQSQTLTMAYMDVMPDNYNGKNILLLHGKNFNGAYWRTTIQQLTANGYRVVVPDQIGFGKSSKPTTYQYSFHQLASNTKQLLDTLGIQHTVVLGHSMGGMLATRFALMYPDMTLKLILENPIGLEDYKTLTTWQSLNDAYSAELKNTYESYRKYQLTFYYDNKWKTEYDEWLNMLAGWTLHPDYPVIARTAALTTDMIMTQPVVYEFGDIKVPTLLIIGTRDRTAIGKDRAPKHVQPNMGLYNKLGRKTQRLIPESKLVELKGVGHMPHIETFDLFITSVLNFLNEK